MGLGGSFENTQYFTTVLIHTVFIGTNQFGFGFGICFSLRPHFRPLLVSPPRLERGTPRFGIWYSIL